MFYDSRRKLKKNLKYKRLKNTSHFTDIFTNKVNNAVTLQTNIRRGKLNQNFGRKKQCSIQRLMRGDYQLHPRQGTITNGLVLHELEMERPNILHY